MSAALPVRLPDRPLVEVAWLVRLRWLAATGQLALVLAVMLGWLAWSLGPLVAVLLVGTASNVALHRSSGRLECPSDPVLTGLLGLDSVLLTVTLLTTGGSSNPFTVLYLVPVVLAALLVRPALTGLVYAVTTLAYGGLFVLGPAPEAHHDAMAMQLHLGGMFAAYGLAGGLLALSLVRIRAAMAEAESRERSARDLQSRAERVAALATLAAGAAHELASPLSTILLIGRELEARAPDARTASDLEELRQEVERCRSVLDQLSLEAGAGRGQTWTRAGLRGLLGRAVEPAHQPVRVEALAEAEARIPAELISQAVRRLLGNARQASGPDQEVLLRGEVVAGALVIEVQDQGEGIPSEHLDRVTEPFFTTRPAGEGRGLGLFFVSGLAHQLGGELSLDSSAGEGTRATLRLPLEEADV